MTEPIEKQCTQCLAFKPLSEFHNDKNKKDGKRAECRCCTSESNRQYRAANREKRRECDRKRYAANPEKYKEDRRKRHAANPEKLREYDRKRHAANPEKYKEYGRKHYTRARHARNQCAVFRGLDTEARERLEAKLKALNPLRT